ncbi:MAG: endonuclease/exonuclease/phosphatase family protein [Kiritimatiellae bacterium]|nr:endonuclease/exonuclease/phosphatase family protein [Kiritimatiellia bacterium]
MRNLTAVALCAAALPSFAAKPHDGEIRIMSYNVRHCRGVDNKVDAAKTADAIKSVNPDFACLNEVKPDVALRLGKLTGMFATPCGMRSKNAILSRVAPIRIEEVALPWTSYGPRSLMICEFQDFAVGVMHFDCGEKSVQCRFESAKVVRETLARYSKPVFIAGDWNAEPDTRPVQELKKCLKILSAENVRTWHGFGQHKKLQPGKDEYCIDYVAVDAKSAERFALVETHVVKDDVTSDHYPVVATVRMMSNL